MVLFPIEIFSQSSVRELNKIAVDYFQCEKYDSALVYFDKVLSINPKDTMGYIDRALTKEKLHDFTGAIADYTRLAKLAPNEVDAYFLRATVLYELGFYDASMIDFQHSLSLENDNAYGYYYIGKIVLKKGNEKEAKTYFKNAIFHNPEHAESFYELAKFEYDHGSLDSARQLVDKSIRYFPRGEAFLLKCLIEYRLNNFVEAINSLENVLEKSPVLLKELLDKSKLVKINQREVNQFLELSSTSNFNKIVLLTLQGRFDQANQLIQLLIIEPEKMNKVLFLSCLISQKQAIK